MHARRFYRDAADAFWRSTHRRPQRIDRPTLSLHFPPKNYECDCVLCECEPHR